MEDQLTLEDRPRLKSGWAYSRTAKMEHFYTEKLERSICGTSAKHNVMCQFEPDAPKQGGCPRCLRGTGHGYLVPKKEN